MEFITEQNNISLSPQDRGLLYGDGFFTTVRIANHQPVFWPLHQQRLVNSAKRLGFSDFDVTLLDSKLDDLPVQGILKIIVTRGEGKRGYAIPATSLYKCIIQVTDLPDNRNILTTALNLNISNVPASKNQLLAGIKHLNRLDNVLARTAALNAGFDDGLMMCDGNVISATQANVFFVTDGKVETPRLTSAGVEGVMKKQVIDWLSEKAIVVNETDISEQCLGKYDEVFITNCVMGVSSVNRVNQFDFTNHIVTDYLHSKFQSIIQ
ncbi:aminodeoxychorismate lyase [Pleionea mediterranea]|uniref:Aminodeoxychorismate lyase n=1 Tax=Pleionea mediterranea TaxID=523701 RepID=A0A316FKP1_9GAMM|nr:aminodeoxychorismate lyase [Pleionea mediterranea]PWK49274.1 aminodeoxychorismate lyase apoprotein [Pleionea mediterranea]